MSNFNEKQLKELESSAIASDLAQMHIFPVDGEQAQYSLFYALPPEERRNDGRVRDKWLSKYEPILKHGGLAFHGYDPLTNERTECISFKPNQPLSRNRKYEQPPKSENQAFYPGVTDRVWKLVSDRFGVPMPVDSYISFWTWVWENNIPIIITEGCKKALAGMSLGFPTIALTGIWNGFITNRDENGKTESYDLIPSLINLNDTKIYIAFDRDKAAATIKSVIQARSILAKKLIEIGCECYSLRWDSNEAKGLDDLIVGCGVEALERSILDAQQLTGEMPDFKTKPIATHLAEKIAKEWKGRLLYDYTTRTWNMYQCGVWHSLSNDKIEHFFYQRIIEDYPDLQSHNYVITILKFTRANLSVEK
jgi:Domain of unknown function (DUF3854)